MNPARPGQQRERIFVGVRLRPQSEKERHANDTPVWIAADAKTLEYVGEQLRAPSQPSNIRVRNARRPIVWSFMK